MSLDRIIRERLQSHPEEWAWNGSRHLLGPGVRLVRPNGQLWSFVVGERLGYVTLSVQTHFCIQMALLLRRIPDRAEARPAPDPESASPYGVGNGPAPAASPDPVEAGFREAGEGK